MRCGRKRQILARIFQDVFSSAPYADASTRTQGDFVNTTFATQTIDGIEYSPFIESDADASAEELRERMSRHGYLFFRGLVPADDVLSLRREVLNLCREANWLDPNADLIDGIARPGQRPLTEGMPEYLAVYRKVLKHPQFHAFPQHPHLMNVAQKLLNHEPFVHPRRMGRITFPHFAQATTPAHQDHFYIRGAVETYSCWIPLGECPIELGGLAVADGSHRYGFIEHSEHLPGAVGGRGVPIDETQTSWHTGDFGLGDALWFHSYSIHKAMPNRTEDQLRVSTDNRYQKPKDSIDPASLKPHYYNGEE
jgi:ectoine hydroxylase-related dioxygenase (phytanoyl-CoA dioxygenase family)